jgi:hypothetical protein
VNRTHLKITDCSLIRTQKFLGSLLENMNAGHGIIGICPWIRKHFVNTGRTVHRPYPRPSFFGTGRSTLLTESSGIGKKRKTVNKAPAHAQSTCHIPKERENYLSANLHCAQCICRLFVPPCIRAPPAGVVYPPFPAPVILLT